MEKLIDTGKVKPIGVSDSSIKTLNQLLPRCKIIPATNQVEMHPCLPQTELKMFCEERGILLTAYSSLGFGSSPNFVCSIADAALSILERPPAPGDTNTTIPILVAGPALLAVADKHGATPGQIGQSSVMKLDEADMRALDTLHERPRMHRSLLTYPGSNGSILGWTYEQLG
ncbi:hypothetical protein HETIRDRAFT_482239 [Heterobasidion irregulare TC 32-1]|uniref:NADP-dependent oxidoreductase domain-containing protein n=1 Tax=Heterobasidion irregulare (strain TC 32-1) TaxID=747525 RepID=W4JPQ4_HETIT|nr:uncharacterized protein HETIRDRAFT_482239 [Heterobasidion irregulare TC 32-1]ETW75513.1 hypothetical protein HETIRDRAFT_482239 [Heterobasidion irregulare TC 32-1]